MSQRALALLLCLVTMAACGGDTSETLSSASTAVATSTSTTIGVGDGSTSPGGDQGDEPLTTEPAAEVDSTSTEPTVESTATTATTAPVADSGTSVDSTTGVDSSTTTSVDSSVTTGEPLPASSGPAPWSAAPLELADLPDVYRLEWAEAGEPTACPFLALQDLGPEAAEATIRRGEHDRNMLVVWDNPDGPGHDRRSEPCSDCGRGVVGLGTWQDGADAVGPATVAWDDGSYANVGTASPWVLYGVTARIQPAGADCMYQLWSHLGVEHVEYLISRLRRVSP